MWTSQVYISVISLELLVSDVHTARLDVQVNSHVTNPFISSWEMFGLLVRNIVVIENKNKY